MSQTLRLRDPQTLIGERVVIHGTKRHGKMGFVIKIRDDAAMVRLDSGEEVAVAAPHVHFFNLTHKHLQP